MAISVTVISAPETGRARIHESPGGQLWTVTPEGLQEFKDGKWLLHPVREIAEEFRLSPRHLPEPIPLCPVRQGLVIFLLGDRLMEFNSEDPDDPRTSVLLDAARTQCGKFTGMVVARDGGLWITGTRGLLKIPGPVRNLKPPCDFQDHPPPNNLQLANFRDPHNDTADGITAIADTGTNQPAALAHFDGAFWRVEHDLPQRVRHAWCGEGQTCWASTPDSLYQRESGGPWAENEEIAARQYFDVTVEAAGVFWIASSDGLFRYGPLAWQTPPVLAEANSPVPCLAGDAENIWFVAGNLVCALPQDAQADRVLYSFPLGSEQSPRALYPLKNGTLLPGGR